MHGCLRHAGGGCDARQAKPSVRCGQMPEVLGNTHNLGHADAAFRGELCTEVRKTSRGIEKRGKAFYIKHHDFGFWCKRIVVKTELIQPVSDPGSRAIHNCAVLAAKRARASAPVPIFSMTRQKPTIPTTALFSRRSKKNNLALPVLIHASSYISS